MTIFFFNDTATTEIYTLSLHDALPILERAARPQTIIERVEVPVLHEEQVKRLEELVVTLRAVAEEVSLALTKAFGQHNGQEDRKSTRLNSSHANISYAVFCLKKKNTNP